MIFQHIRFACREKVHKKILSAKMVCLYPQNRSACYFGDTPWWFLEEWDVIVIQSYRV